MRSEPSTKVEAGTIGVLSGDPGTGSGRPPTTTQVSGFTSSDRIARPLDRVGLVSSQSLEPATQELDHLIQDRHRLVVRDGLAAQFGLEELIADGHEAAGHPAPSQYPPASARPRPK